MIICQGVPIMHHFERFTVDLDEKLGDSLLGCPQLYHNMRYINEKSTELLQCFWLPNLDLNQGPSD